MFERFTDDARDAVVGAQEQCRRHGHPAIGTAHLLLALVEGTGPTADLLRGRGVTLARADEALAEVLARHPSSRRTPPADSTQDDAAALAALGIDLQRIRSALESSFGPGALERAGRRGRRRRPGLPSFLASRLPGPGGHPRGGHIPFAPEAKKALELSLREALRLGDGSIGAEHVLLGLIRGDGVAHGMLLALDVDTVALRRDLEASRRRSA